MCCFNAIIFFDFGVVATIFLSRSHFAVSGSSAKWEVRIESYSELPSDYQTRAFFYLCTTVLKVFHPFRPSSLSRRMKDSLSSNTSPS